MVSISVRVKEEQDGYRAYSLVYGDCLAYERTYAKLIKRLEKFGFIVIIEEN